MGDIEGQPTEETPTPETPEAEQPETPEAPAEEPEAAEAKPEGEEGEEPAAPEETAEEKHRRKGGWQRKAERLEREKEALVQRLLGQPQPAPATPEKPKDPAAQVQEYVSALVKEQLEAERAQAKQAEAQANFQKRMQEVNARHPDFEDALESVAHIAVPPPVLESLLTSDVGPEIMYRLAKNPAELARISALPPLVAAREIGRLEAQASSTPAPKASIKSATRPPAPPTSVNGSASSARNPDDLPIADYKRAFRSKR